MAAVGGAAVAALSSGIATQAQLVAHLASARASHGGIVLTLSGPRAADPGAHVKFSLALKGKLAKLRSQRATLVLSKTSKPARGAVVLAKPVRLASRGKRHTLTVPLKVTIPRSVPAQRWFAVACVGPKKQSKKHPPLCAALRFTVLASGSGTTTTTPTTTTTTGTATTTTTGTTTTTTTTGTTTTTTTGTTTTTTATTPAPAPGPTDAPAPDPASLAPALPTDQSTSMLDATSFLYTGANAIQHGVSAGTITAQRVAVLRGSVTDASGTGIGGVRVTVLGHPDYGYTDTQANGDYDIAVNGGGTLTLDFERAGYIPAQRTVQAPWQDYAAVDPLVMVHYTDQSSVIDPNSPAAFDVAQGPAETDAAGSREQTLLFPHGEQATMSVDGSPQPVSDPFTVRATEVTVGPKGPDQMPGELPKLTAYTYAAEFTIDQAVSAGASSVNFSEPVISYTDNFIGFPVGSTVPTGSYDRATGTWIGSNDGIVLKIVSITNGLADLDLTGGGTATPALYAAWGITDAERAELATLYAAGKELWRTRLSHFSLWDFNWPPGPAPGASGPNAPGPRTDGGCRGTGCQDPCRKGSIIRCTSQSLGESLPVTGTPFSLTYRSDFQAGAVGQRTIDIPLVAQLPPSTSLFQAVVVDITVAGQHIVKSFDASSLTPNQQYQFVWNGLDAYGRPGVGTVVAHVRVGFVFGYLYAESTATGQGWNQLSASGFDVARGPSNYTVWSPSTNLDLNAATQAQQGAGLGGWGLSALDSYDPVGGILTTGAGDSSDGTVANAPALSLLAGDGGVGFGGYGGPATSAGLNEPRGVAVGPDGSIYIADTGNDVVSKVDPSGNISLLAGTPGHYGHAGDGGPATSATLSSPEGVAVGPDGSIYIADTGADRVRRVAPDGTITTVAGGGTPADGLGDGLAATSAELAGPSGVAVSPDGTLYIADTLHHRVRAVGTDAVISTVAGTGNPGFSGDGGPASQATLRTPGGVAVDHFGNLYIADTGNNRIRQVAPDGLVTTVAGGGSGSGNYELATSAALQHPTGVSIAADGTVLIAEAGAGEVRAVLGGEIITVAGGGGQAPSNGMQATAAQLQPVGVAARPDGSFVLVETAGLTLNSGDEVWGSQPVYPGFEGDAFVARGDGTIDEFTPGGRLIRNRDALTGAIIYQFEYDSAGRLTAIDDASSLASSAVAPLLTIRRDSSGNPLALVARGGQTTALTLGSDRYLASVADPAQDTTKLAYQAGGLLTQLTDPAGGIHTFQYDSSGLLTKDTAPGGSVQTLARSDLPGGGWRVALDSNGLTTDYDTSTLPDGSMVSKVTAPSGAVTTTTVGADGSVTTDLPDGTTDVLKQGPDPRFGMEWPILASDVKTTPGGRTLTETGSRVAGFSDLNTLNSQTDTVTVNGEATTSVWNGSTRTLTITSPAGRQRTITLDTDGRFAQIVPTTGSNPIDVTYEATGAGAGQVATISQGNYRLTMGYDAGGRVATITDALGHTITRGYDADGRLTSVKLPSGRTYAQTYDANGNLSTVTLPGTGGTSSQYAFTSTPDGLSSTYTAPGETSSFSRSYNAQRSLDTTTLPSGAIDKRTYNAKGQVIGDSTTAAGGAADTATTYGYAGNTDLLATSTWNRASGTTKQIYAQSYDGELPTTLTFSGRAAGTFTLTPDQNFDVSNLAVSSGATSLNYAITRDPDRLMQTFGSWTFTHDPQTGMETKITDGGSNVLTLGYDANADPSQRTLMNNSSTLFDLSGVKRDDAGRITEVAQTIAGATRTLDYTYDKDGDLTHVTQTIGGTTSPLEQYTYDGDGNRLTAAYNGGAATATTYNSDDQVISSGTTGYTYDSSGFLVGRGADTFDYDARGELLDAMVGGHTVTYDYDALGRLVRRNDGSTYTTFLYGNPVSPYQVTATNDNTGTLSTYVYDDNGDLAGVERGGQRYTVATDFVGTPWLVADSSGNVVRLFNHDTYGRVLPVTGSQTDPSFYLPIGFAGGIEDPLTGFVRFGTRDYDSATGRWTARDPSAFDGSPLGLYQYAGGDPVDNTDPTGLFCVGGSLYALVGGGGSVCVDTSGVTSCVEGGVGLGAGTDFDLFAKGTPGDSTFAEAGVQAGPISVTENYSPGPCSLSSGTVQYKFAAGPIYGTATQQVVNGEGQPISQFGGGVDQTEGLTAELKAGKKKCLKATW